MNRTEAMVPKAMSHRSAGLIILGTWCAFGSALIWPTFTARSGLTNAVLLWSAITMLCLGLAWLKNQRSLPEITIAIRTPHYVQMLVQGSVFAYWGWYWPPVYDYVPLILSQVLFAYLMELAVCWFKYGKWRIGLPVADRL